MSPVLLGAAAIRISRFGESLHEAHLFGVEPGGILPWTIDYQRAAFELYLPHLSETYLSQLGSVFAEAAGAAAALDGADAEVVTRYLETCSLAITEGLGPTRTSDTTDFTLNDRTPAVMPFTDIAALVARTGAIRLMEAGRAVHELADTPADAPVSPEELGWLQRLAHGIRIIDLAAETNYSERSMYRHLSDLWRRLGVRNRQEAIVLAAHKGRI